MKSPAISLQVLLAIFCSIISTIFLSATYVSARPTEAPVGGNLGAPIFTNTEAATKSGSLTINGTLATNTTTATTASAPTVCINGDCRSSWPNLTPPSPGINNVIDAGNSTSSYPYFHSGGGLYMQAYGQGYAFRTSWPNHYLSFSGETGQVDTGGSGYYPLDRYCPNGYYISSTQANIWARLQWFRCSYIQLN